MSGPMMKCGHAAQGVRHGTLEPVCVICVGTTPDARIVDDNPPDLSERKMRCSYQRSRDGKPCSTRVEPIPSNPKAAFFSHRPDEDYDQFYCGCWGWD